MRINDNRAASRPVSPLVLQRKVEDRPGGGVVFMVLLGFVLVMWMTAFTFTEALIVFSAMFIAWMVLSRQKFPDGSWFIVLGVGMVGTFINIMLRANTEIDIGDAANYSEPEYIVLGVGILGLASLGYGIKKAQKAQWRGNRTWSYNHHDSKTYIPCQNCRKQAPTKQVSFGQVTGLILVMQHRRLSGRLCKGCINEKFWEMTGMTAVMGWWGVTSFIVTCITLPINIVQYLAAMLIPPTNTHVVLQLDSESTQRINRYHGDIISRVQQGEQITKIANEISALADTTPREVEVYIMMQMMNVKR